MFGNYLMNLKSDTAYMCHYSLGISIKLLLTKIKIDGMFETIQF